MCYVRYGAKCFCYLQATLWTQLLSRFLSSELNSTVQCPMHVANDGTVHKIASRYEIGMTYTNQVPRQISIKYMSRWET